MWAAVVATENALACRRIARGRRHQSIVTDRWIVDHLVDFELRYGRHGLANRILRTGVRGRTSRSCWRSTRRPPPSASPATRSERAGVDGTDLSGPRREFGLIPVDGRASPEEVEFVLLALVDSLLATG